MLGVPRRLTPGFPSATNQLRAASSPPSRAAPRGKTFQRSGARERIKARRMISDVERLLIDTLLPPQFLLSLMFHSFFLLFLHLFSLFSSILLSSSLVSPDSFHPLPSHFLFYLLISFSASASLPLPLPLSPHVPPSFLPFLSSHPLLFWCCHVA